MQDLPLTHGPVTFEAAVDLIRHDDGLQPVRAPVNERALWHPALLDRTDMPAGVRLVTAASGGTVELALRIAEPANLNEGAVDLVVDGELAGRKPITGLGEHLFRFEGLKPKEKRVEVYLPQTCACLVRRLSIEDGATAIPWSDGRPRWVTYGSSITHCGAAHGPSRTWPALAARLADVHLTCLGVGGSCHFDPVMARQIARRPADRISLKLGINTHGGGYGPRTWTPAVTGLILTIRDGHPDTPLLIVSPIFSPGRETEAGGTGLTLVEMRQALAELVEVFRARGDANIHYLDGLQLLGADDADHLPDGLHPDGDGYELMGRRFAELAFGDNGPLGRSA